jgi:hypothetical protein
MVPKRRFSGRRKVPKHDKCTPESPPQAPPEACPPQALAGEVTFPGHEDGTNWGRTLCAPNELFSRDENGGLYPPKGEARRRRRRRPCPPQAFAGEVTFYRPVWT